MKKTDISLLLSMALISPIFASSIELEKVIVTTPTKSTQSLKNTTANVTIITSDYIKAKGYKTIADALKAEAGISYTRNGGLGKSTSIMLRGLSQKRTLVLIDGVRYNDPASISGAHLQHILMENIQRIEIVKGAQSGIWGADASAGVINIITKKANKEGFVATINAEYGSYNTLTYGLSTSYTTEKYDISLAAQQLSTDGFTTKVPEGKDASDYEDDQYENSSVDLKLGVNISENDRIETFFNYIDADSDFDGYNSDASKAANDAVANSKATEKFYGINYTREEGANSTKIYYNKSDFSRTSTTSRVSKFDGSVDELGINSNIVYGVDSNFGLGFDYKKFKHENKIDKSYTNKALFLTNSNNFDALSSGTTIFSQALRYDKFDDFDNKFTYKLGLKHIHKNIQDFWTSINYATAYNVPSLFQLYSYAGNKELNPEKTKSLDITASYKGVAVTYFNNTIDEMIEYVTTDPLTYAGSYFNVSGETTLKGVELSYSDMIEASSLAYNINYTYLKTEDKDGKELARRAKSTANLSLDYYGIDRAHIGTLLQYVGSRKKSKYDKHADVDYKSYMVMDVTADYDLNKQLNIYTKIDNILDKEYQTITGYATSGRAYYLGFRYKIK